MIAVVGIRGDNDQSGKGTTLRIFDPWPPMRGKKYSVGYFKWIQEVPTRLTTSTTKWVERMRDIEQQDFQATCDHDFGVRVHQ